MKKLLFYTILIFISGNLFAVRPFITDDARVVGWRLAQWETWLRFDRHSGQQWHMFAYGPHRRIELTGGAVLGYDKPENENHKFSYALPLVQGKYLIRPYEPGKPPGVALVAGSFFPGGRGAFVPSGYGTFGFLIISQCFGEGEKVLIHANLGANYLYLDKDHEFINTWGLGTQVKVYKGMHWVGEVFSGDPYIPGSGIAYQTGLRYFISEDIQLDMTLGKGFHGENPLPFWFSAGARLVTRKFEKKN